MNFSDTKKQSFEELANYLSNDLRGKKRWSQSKNIVIPMTEINDYKYSNKKLYELSQNQGKEKSLKIFILGLFILVMMWYLMRLMDGPMFI